MKKNRIWKMVAGCLSGALLLTGCGAQASDVGRVDTVSASASKKSIVCTTYPQYDWVCEILGEKKDQFEVTLLLDNGVDLHSYQPTAMDMVKISTADAFIYVGGESENWVEDALKEVTNKNIQVMNMVDVLGERVKPEEFVEGMEHHHDHEHDEEHENHEHDDEHEHDEEHENHEHDDEHEHDEEHENHEHDDDHERDEEHENHEHGDEHEHDEEHENHEHEHETDEHIWLSLKNAKLLVESITDLVVEMDRENELVYEKNCNDYVEKLNALDQEYEQLVNASEKKTVVVGDRFPFRYLMDDYGISYYAAFAGCSAETEASFETVTFLAGKIDELSLKSILVLENAETKLAETIKQNTTTKDQNILHMDSIQTVTQTDIANGFTYLKAMQENLEVLKEVLGM